MPRIKRPWRPNKKRIPWKAIRKHNRRRTPSSLELKVYGWLDDDNIEFTREKAVGRSLHVDIYIKPNLCIELNGCHWHGCMICNPQLTKDQRVAQVKDARRYHSIRTLGFDVVVFWECEVNQYPDRVRDQLRALAKER